ncbi:MAG: TIGR04282 family arsenosugar biosynthesis glycosyltransferase [Hyphomonadaceae bacterium]
MNRSVLIFAKPPLIGLSKTRLARSLGKSEARRIARMTMAKTLREVCGATRWNTVLYSTPDKYLPCGFGGLWPEHLERRSQGTGDLTARLDKGLFEALRGQVLFIGSDAPDVSRALIWRAFETLKTHDAVFGPASDGGFWLFGMHKGARTVTPFGNNVRWSGPHAMADVRANLGESAKVAELPMLIDIDEADDWRAWRGF